MVKNDDLKKTAIIASQLVLINKTDLKIDMITAHRQYHSKVVMDKDKLIPVSCRNM